MIRLSALLLGLSLVAGCATEARTESETQAASVTTAPTIASDDALVTVLEGLSAAASFGPSLARFTWNEGARVEALGQCRPKTAEEAAAAFDGIVDQVYAGGDLGEAPFLNDAAIADAKDRFRALLGSEAYLVCSRSVSGFMSAGHITTIVGATNGLRAQFETGWED